MVYVPLGVPVDPLVVETLRAELADAVPGDTEVGEKVHLAPLGSPEHVRLADQVKLPPSAFTVIV
jgi:hypothetical protein